MTGPAPRRWGLGDVAVGLVPVALSTIGYLGTLGSDEPDPSPTLAGLVIGSLFLWVFLIGAPLVATIRKGGGPARDLGLRFRWIDLAAFPLGCALQALVIPALYWPILEVLDRSDGDVENEARELVDAASGPGVLLLVLVVAIGAPFAEELFYRGLLLRAVEKRWTLAAGAVAATVLFALAHLQGIQLPALLLFGAVATYLAVRTGRLGPSILCHVGFNSWTLFLLLVVDPS